MRTNVGNFCNKDCRHNYAISHGVGKALAYVRKKKNQELRQRRKEVRPMSEWHDHLQSVVNQWVVHVRDKNKPCCTCGTENPNIVYAAGHYRSRGSCPELRFELTNIHKQCNVQCNQIKSGARCEYRAFIAYNYGSDHLNWLDGPHKPLKEQFENWQEVEQEIKHYRKLLREAGIKPCR